MEALERYIGDGLTVREAIPTSPAGPRQIRDQGGDKLMEKVFPKKSWPVENLIVEGLTLLCGAPKLGKSWLALNLCLSVATGTRCLGRRTEEGDVLYLAYEDSEQRLQKRLQTLGRPVPAAFRYDTGDNVVSMTGGLVEVLEGWVDAHPDAKLIVIDTLAKVRPVARGRVNAYDEDYRVIGQLKTFADRRHIALVLVHHLNKTKDDGGDIFSRISGTNGLTGAADTMLVLDRKRGEDDGTLYITGRDVWGDDIPMKFKAGVWTACDAATIERERYEAQPVVRAIKVFIATHTTTAASYDDFKDWAAGQGYFVGATRNEVHKALDRLAEQFAQYDGIHFVHRQIGTKRGFEVKVYG